jgi:hypothetical protein
MESDAEGIGLDEVLEALRADLALVRAKSAGADIQFPIESLTVELQVGVTRSKGGQAGFRVPVLDLGLGGNVGVDRQNMQTVTVVFGGPVDPAGAPVKVATASDELKG